MTDEEHVKRIEELMKKGNTEAFNTYGRCHFLAEMGFAKDTAKAMEAFLKAGKLGCPEGDFNRVIFITMCGGENVKQAMYYYEKSAMMGSIPSRRNLACLERDLGGPYHAPRSCHQYIIAARAGDEYSMEMIKNLFDGCLFTNDKYSE